MGLDNIRLSLCMIVKNEEDCIERCLNSVMDTVDEIIIVDTGSTDKTIDICRRFAKTKIETFPWNGSFADARNYSIEKASGTWFIWMDADEEMEKDAREKIRAGNHFDEFDVISIHLVNYYGDKVDPNKSTDTAHPRLFRNNGLQFENRIHESIDYTHIPIERIAHIDVKIHHYGYMDSVMKKKGKRERNLNMLKKQIEKGEKEYWAHYYIALEYYNQKNFEEAFDHADLSAMLFLQTGLLPPSMVYKLKYSILVATETFDLALPGIETAIRIYPDYVDLHWLKGVTLYFLGRYEEAISSFDDCLELGEDNLNYLSLKGTGSFQALYYKSHCQLKLNKKEEAVASLVKALVFAPNFKEAREALAQLKL